MASAETAVAIATDGAIGGSFVGGSFVSGSFVSGSFVGAGPDCFGVVSSGLGPG